MNTIKVLSANSIDIISDIPKGVVQNMPSGLSVEFKGENSLFTFHKSTKFKATNIIIGNNCNIDIGETIFQIIAFRVYATSNNTYLTIGKNFSCWGAEVKLEESYTGLHIGNNCMFSYGISIRTTDGHIIYDLDSSHVVNIGEDVFIGNHVWLGYSVTILKGSFIQDDSVVGSNSLVCSKFKQGNIIIGGNPAKIIKENINWSRQPVTDYKKTGVINI